MSPSAGVGVALWALHHYNLHYVPPVSERLREVKAARNGLTNLWLGIPALEGGHA
jgi:hypothetical protein